MADALGFARPSRAEARTHHEGPGLTADLVVVQPVRDWTCAECKGTGDLLSDCVLACYSAAGFHDGLRTVRDPRLALITLDDIYA